MGARAAWIDIDLDAVRHNVGYLRSLVGEAKVMVVVKANGYGHGAVQVAEAALEAGAHGLCVALVEEGIELRRAGIESPILVLSEQPLNQVGDIVAHGLIATAYSISFIDALEQDVRRRNVVGQEVHLKIDTGMNRVGCKPSDAVELGGRIMARSPQLVLGGVFTHLASADDVDPVFTENQIAKFDTAIAALHQAGVETGWIHIANSAGAIAHARSHRDMVRVGIALYGIAPDIAIENLCTQLRPALSLKACVTFVKKVAAGDGISYGQRHHFEKATTVATVPLGYADGVPRRLSAVGGEVLIGGRRCPIVGVVTMDQLMVDVGDQTIAVGDEVVLIGTQGTESVSANELGSRLGTIGYEIVCGLSNRLPRHYR